MGGRSPQPLLLVGAVQVDKAPVRVDPRPAIDPLLQSAQAQDAGQDEVAVAACSPVGARHHFAVVTAGYKYGSNPAAVSDPVGDLMLAGGRLMGVLPVAEPFMRG